MHFKLVENLLHIKTIGLSAINTQDRIKLIKTIEHELNHVLIRKELIK